MPPRQPIFLSNAQPCVWLVMVWGALLAFFQVTVGPRETLLITHVDDAGEGGSQTSPFTLWAWNPARQRWAWDSGLLPSALIGERVAWSPSGIGLWCTHARLSVTHPLELFSYFFTANDLS